MALFLVLLLAVACYGMKFASFHRDYISLPATTAIKEMAIETPSSTAIYNLQGQKVGTRKDLNQLKRGIYVVNGKLIRNGSR